MSTITSRGPSTLRVPSQADATAPAAAAATGTTAPARDACLHADPGGRAPAAEPGALASAAAGGVVNSTMNLRLAEVSGPARTAPVQLDAAQLGVVVNKKATCPFIGTAVQQGALPVRNNTEAPLAAISDVAALGNSGGGDLGELLKLFARGNHSRMPGAPGAPAPLTPAGHFSLDFPGSQGSHPGHSGILQGDPAVRDSGRLSRPDLERLLARAQDGHLKTSDIGKFIAENLARDPGSKVLGKGVVGLLAGDVADTVLQSGPALLEKLRNLVTGAHDTRENVKLYEKLTRTLGEDNLVGSAGEFGLLLAMLANSPRTTQVDGEMAVSVEDAKAMFLEKRFPDGWETWPKTRHDWVVATTRLTAAAVSEYHGLHD